jgi:hypothetical protein
MPGISWSRSVTNGVELRAECPHLLPSAPRSAGGSAADLGGRSGPFGPAAARVPSGPAWPRTSDINSAEIGTTITLRSARLEGSRWLLPRLIPEMSDSHPQPSGDRSLELPVDVVLKRARPLPPHDEMVIEDLSPDEGAEFLAALEA